MVLVAVVGLAALVAQVLVLLAVLVEMDKPQRFLVRLPLLMLAVGVVEITAALGVPEEQVVEVMEVLVLLVLLVQQIQAAVAVVVTTRAQLGT
jgi:hypothetical protein